MKVQETTAQSILTESKLPDADYVVNPYTGCQFGCSYCYASFMGRFVKEPIESWGDYLYVKINAVELFERDFARLKSSGKTPSILLSSVTDPYQGPEKQYELSRGILKILARDNYQGLVSILTKSPLVLRDIDVLREIPQVEVGLTITTTDDKISRFLEVRAPLASTRIETLRSLHNAGIPTYAFIGPLLPHFRYETEELDKLFGAVASTGTRRVFVEHINLKQYIRQRLWPELEGLPEHVRNIYREATGQEHRDALQRVIDILLAKHHLELRLNRVLYHEADKKQSKQSAKVEVDR